MVIPNGYNPLRFAPANTNYARKKLNLAENARLLVNIGNLEEYKGQKYLIESMKTILAAHQDVMLYIVGQGSLKPELQSLINRYDLQSRVILAGGNKPADEIPLWMNACDVFVLPSISEGNPTVMFEALACGKPFVGTKVGGIPEIITNNKLGILVEPRDPEGWRGRSCRRWRPNGMRSTYGNMRSSSHGRWWRERIVKVYEKALK